MIQFYLKLKGKLLEFGYLGRLCFLHLLMETFSIFFVNGPELLLN